MKPNRVYTHILLDKSQSMGHIQRSTVDAINEYVDTLRSEGSEARISLTSFNSQGTVHSRDLTPINSFEPISQGEYRPAGMTPLYDAICNTIEKARKVDRLPHEGFALVIVTDGLENASQRYNLDDATRMIKELQNNEDLVIYLGANQDGWAEGRKMGVRAETSVTYDTGNIRGTMAMTAGKVNSYAASGATMDACFSDDDRAETMKTPDITDKRKPKNGDDGTSV